MNKGLWNTGQGELDSGRDVQHEAEVEKGKPAPWNGNGRYSARSLSVKSQGRKRRSVVSSEEHTGRDPDGLRISFLSPGMSLLMDQFAGREERRWRDPDQARGSLCRISEEGRGGREEPLSENTAGFGD